MKKIFLLFFMLIITCSAFSQDAASVCVKINDLNTAVLNNTITRKDAARQFGVLIGQLQTSTRAVSTRWVFPLKGYKSSAIGGTNGNGYSDKGYNYLDGNKHTAHPAHDIFINDKNQDGLDDHSQKPVDVLAVNDGIVIACSDTWDTGSSLRGGKYIWLYHPTENIISYYAHNSAIDVKPGETIKQGQKIAEVGRTGFNAYKKRSPTHLHFSSFVLKNNIPVPFNCYLQLKQATTK